MPAKTLLGHTGDHARPASRRNRTYRILAGAVLLVATASAAPAVASAATVKYKDTSTIYLKVSSEADRSPGRKLSGATLTESSFIFVNDGRIKRAQFWLDDSDHSGKPTNIETAAPFDLKPGLNPGWQRQVAISKLAVGKHSVLARLSMDNGQTIWLGDAFWVKKATTGGGTPVTTPPVTTAPPTTKPTKPVKPPTTTTQPPVTTTTKPPATGGGSTSGRPNAANTGVPAGTKLTNSGPLTVTQDGAVISGLNISGCVRVNATNVTIKNSKISCGDSTKTAIVLNDGDTGLTVMDTEINGLKKAKTAVYAADGVTLLRLNIHDIEDGPRVYNNFTMKSSWVHDLYQPVSGYHVDGVQSIGAHDVVIQGNSFEVYNHSSDHRMNSVFMMTTDVNPYLRNILFSGNYVNGGVCSINMGLNAVGVSNVVFRDNTFGPDSAICTHVGLDRSGVTWASTNVWASNGDPVNR